MFQTQQRGYGPQQVGTVGGYYPVQTDGMTQMMNMMMPMMMMFLMIGLIMPMIKPAAEK